MAQGNLALISTMSFLTAIKVEIVPICNHQKTGRFSGALLILREGARANQECGSESANVISFSDKMI
ncbi:hypothetical protein [Pantoea sp. paga]|uniref:hypothetical protein n=1 Tax=Pantoea sp. paga TaxID=2597519 RepID=UPI00117DE54F|nr:hypothetical protein [Pantoea sp. paga]TSH78291.1 hypothetical protein FOV68_23015 [Pantoea sp. paga]